MLRVTMLWISLLGMTVYSRFHPIFFTLNFLASSFVVFFCLVKFCRRTVRGGESVMALIGVLLPIGWYVCLLMSVRYAWVEAVDTKIESRKFASCGNAGAEFLKNQRLALCAVDNRWWRYGFTTAIIYDSSHQVELSHPYRTLEWEQAARRLVGVDGVPFGIVGFSAKRLGGNYYVVTFQDDALPDF